ncbi:TetR/AcrR family transcriptional regulator [Streptomyces sp. NPDC097619]|uniref:TetR/AcrR family transcriptional regulator n=1 Tax=Streptomyces sp. NPDC097619 TaxID=3157228 RepID=UPI00331ABE8D
MVKQERAARSRNSLVQAAAAQFDLDGYAGASLSRICKAAGISMGGLTFHFSSKEDLARAVEETGRASLQATVDRVYARTGLPLRRLVSLTLELARQVEEELVVRALLRLERERPGAPQWSALWHATARQLVQEAKDSGQLKATARPEAVASLAVHLVTGADVLARRARMPGASATESSAALLAGIWTLVLAGILAPGQDMAGTLPDPAPRGPTPPAEPAPAPRNGSVRGPLPGVSYERKPGRPAGRR